MADCASGKLRAAPLIPLKKSSRYSKPTTAAEFIRELEADSEYQARVRDDERRRQEMWRLAVQEEQSLVRDLRAAGTNVSSLWDLVGTKAPYPKAVPVLIEHLSDFFSPKMLDGLVRALIVPEARGVAWDALEHVLLARKVELARDAPYAVGTILHALGVLATEAQLPGVLRLATDTSLGNYRIAMLKHVRVKNCSAEMADAVSRIVPDEAIALEYRKFASRLLSRSSKRLKRAS